MIFSYIFCHKGEKIVKKTKMLKKNYEFRNVLSKGKFFSGKFVNAVIMNNGKDLNFLGLAISVKTAKAVRRNRIKRFLRENYTRLEEDLENGKSMVFLWKKEASPKEVNFYDVRQDMIKIFDRAKMIKKR